MVPSRLQIGHVNKVGVINLAIDMKFDTLWRSK